MENRSTVPKKNILQTKSNLTFDVFSEILFVIGLDELDFIHKKELINNLVETRNMIAHGDYKNVSYPSFEEYFTATISAMESLKTKLENCAVQGAYKAR